MAITEAYTGSQSVTTTEWSLTIDNNGPTTDTSDGVFQAFIDLNALVAGDTFRLRIYEKDTSSGTQRVVFENFFVGAQSTPLYASPPLILMHGWDMTLYRTAGSDRTITWSIRKVA